MGRPPSTSTGASAGAVAAPALFRFLPSEVAEMEALRLQQLKDGVIIPSHAVLQTLADKFSESSERAGKVVIHHRHVWRWFQNRRYTLPPNATRAAHHGSSSSSSSSSGRNSLQDLLLEFEAKSARDGAWYDVEAFLSHRWLESGDLEVMVRFSGFGAEDDEWINARNCVRQRSLRCGATECVAVVPQDLILCYQEIVPLSKVCRRPETDYRLEILYGARVAATTNVHTPPKEVIVDLTSNNKSPDEHKPKKQNKLMDVNTDEVTMVSSLQQEGAPGKVVSPLLSETSEAGNSSSDATMKEVEASMVVEDGEVQVVPKMKEV